MKNHQIHEFQNWLMINEAVYTSFHVSSEYQANGRSDVKQLHGVRALEQMHVILHLYDYFRSKNEISNWDTRHRIPLPIQYMC